MDPLQRILRRQGLKLARAWLDQEPERLQRFAQAVQARDGETCLECLHQMPPSSYLDRLRAAPENWWSDLAAVLALPPTPPSYMEALRAELHYRALPVSPHLWRSCQRIAQGLTIAEALRLTESEVRPINAVQAAFVKAWGSTAPP